MKKIILSIGFVLASTVVLSQERNNDNEKPKGPPSIKQLFKELDKNEDGKISLKEAKGPLKKDFKKIDTNEDGFLSKAEIKKAPKPERRERPEK
jgi:Ca2+-binding EF-hand superfamily protein